MQSGFLSSLIENINTIFITYNFTICGLVLLPFFVFVQIIQTSDSVQDLAVRLVFELSLQTQQKPKPKSEVSIVPQKTTHLICPNNSCKYVPILRNLLSYFYRNSVCIHLTINTLLHNLAELANKKMLPRIWHKNQTMT